MKKYIQSHITEYYKQNTLQKPVLKNIKKILKSEKVQLVGYSSFIHWMKLKGRKS